MGLLFIKTSHIKRILADASCSIFARSLSKSEDGLGIVFSSDKMILST